MPDPSKAGPSRSSLPLVAAFIAVAVAFIVAAAVTLGSVLDIDGEVVDLEGNSLPSVGSLSHARSDLRAMRAAVDALASAPLAARPTLLDGIATTRRHLEDELATYTATGWYSGERDLFQQEMRPRLDRLDRDTSDLLSAERLESDGPRLEVERRVDADDNAADETLAELLELNHVQSIAAASRIARVRARSVRIALVLETASSLVALLAAGLAIRAEWRLQAVLQRNAELQASRADELETIGQRVAHDLLSPLSSVTFGLGTLAKRHPDEDTARLVERMRVALDRSRRMVRGIFDFARSGARPPKGTQASLAASLAAAQEDVLSGEPDPPTLQVDLAEDVVLACDGAILTVILSNLLSNSTKFMRQSPLRRIEVSAKPTAGGVRVEVRDSGPGVPEGLEQEIFEPYARGPEVTQPGLGLGLATVRRFVVAHGGAVGIERVPEGACFWFELPVATVSPSSVQGLPALP